MKIAIAPYLSYHQILSMPRCLNRYNVPLVVRGVQKDMSIQSLPSPKALSCL